jgi:hypothetical protein
LTNCRYDDYSGLIDIFLAVFYQHLVKIQAKNAGMPIGLFRRFDTRLWRGKRRLPGPDHKGGPMKKQAALKKLYKLLGCQSVLYGTHSNVP